ncbi:MAG TPA: homoserine O-acetyltransferase [Chitinophagaceae bacterium]|jgi:homoserine O-acetyltransferase|nr:homoserine O-acetyltransferase [Chitinophagaceae bacterium]
MNDQAYFHYRQPFTLESGAVLPELIIAYKTDGRLNADRTNAVWICHALTANADVTEWWPGMTGPGTALSPDDYFIVCANILASPYGSSGPLSTNPQTGEPYFSSFPAVTIRDMVRAHILLRDHLGIGSIHLLIGGSMGGYQALEWAVTEPDRIRQLLLLATSATESAWGIAVHTAQRLAIEADATWRQPATKAGREGLKAARAIGMLTYRNYDILVRKQADPEKDKFEGFKAESYILHQGAKLADRFHAYSYWLLTRAMDTHHLARHRDASLEQLLHGILQRTLIIGITSDILCPLNEQKFLAAHMPHATLIEIDSAYGHDGFLVEAETIGAQLRSWMSARGRMIV